MLKILIRTKSNSSQHPSSIYPLQVNKDLPILALWSTPLSSVTDAKESINLCNYYILHYFLIFYAQLSNDREYSKNVSFENWLQRINII